jgi:RecB family exonuclease
MKTANKRLCIYPKDIQRITGKSYRQSIRILQSIRKEHKKLHNEFVSIEEFCQYTSLKIEHVEPLIIG